MFTIEGFDFCSQHPSDRWSYWGPGPSVESIKRNAHGRTDPKWRAYIYTYIYAGISYLEINSRLFYLEMGVFLSLQMFLILFSFEGIPISRNWDSTTLQGVGEVLQPKQEDSEDLRHQGPAATFFIVEAKRYDKFARKSGSPMGLVPRSTQKYDGLFHWRSNGLGIPWVPAVSGSYVLVHLKSSVSTMNRNSRLKFPILRLGLNILHDHIETQEVISPPVDG